MLGGCSDGLLCRWRDACTLDPVNPARFTCGGGIYYAAGGCTADAGAQAGLISRSLVDGRRVVSTCGVTLFLLAWLMRKAAEGGVSCGVGTMGAVWHDGRRCGRDGGRHIPPARYLRMAACRKRRGPQLCTAGRGILVRPCGDAVRTAAGSLGGETSLPWSARYNRCAGGAMGAHSCACLLPRVRGYGRNAREPEHRTGAGAAAQRRELARRVYALEGNGPADRLWR